MDYFLGSQSAARHYDSGDSQSVYGQVCDNSAGASAARECGNESKLSFSTGKFNECSLSIPSSTINSLCDASYHGLEEARSALPWPSIYCLTIIRKLSDEDRLHKTPSSLVQYGQEDNSMYSPAPSPRSKHGNEARSLGRALM